MLRFPEECVWPVPTQMGALCLSTPQPPGLLAYSGGVGQWLSLSVPFCGMSGHLGRALGPKWDGTDRAGAAGY